MSVNSDVVFQSSVFTHDVFVDVTHGVVLKRGKGHASAHKVLSSSFEYSLISAAFLWAKSFELQPCFNLSELLGSVFSEP